MATEGEAVTKAATTEEPEKVVTEKPKATKEKKPKAPKEKKPKQSKSLSHPPYFQMITEALTAQQEKSGSSPYAIGKYMEEQHKDELPPNFRKILAVQLKHFAAKGKLIKIKASYKLAEATKKDKPRTTTTTTSIKKTRSVTKIKAEAAVAVPKPKKAKKSTAAKPKQPKSIKSSAAKKTKKITA